MTYISNALHLLVMEKQLDSCFFVLVRFQRKSVALSMINAGFIELSVPFYPLFNLMRLRYMYQKQEGHRALGRSSEPESVL